MGTWEVGDKERCGYFGFWIFDFGFEERDMGTRGVGDKEMRGYF
jgi:hypothetical protein